MNLVSAISPASTLAGLPLRSRARVASVEWDRLAPPEARRLRELGLDEGVEIELMHRAGLLGGPIACRIGRMTVALRRHVAHAVHVLPIAD
jgi:ferrous iron transport protein A